MRAIARLVFLFAISSLSGALARGDDGVIVSVKDSDPIIPMPKTAPSFAPGLLDLWLVALDRPEVEMRTSAATAIASAHRRGMPGLAIAIDPLRKALDRTDQHPDVRLAAGTALVALNAKATADSLLKASEAGAEFRELTYPALARWDHPPARAVWLGVLDKPLPSTRSHLLAVRALGAVREANAIPKLRELLFANEATAPLRIEIARALAAISPAGLEADARRCTADPLAAVTLLRHHRGDEAVRLLQGYAASDEAGVAGVAVERLLEIDPKLALPGLSKVLANSEPETRRLGVEVMVRFPVVEHIGTLSKLLADTHPLVRNGARRALQGYAGSAALRSAVQVQLIKTLDLADWRGQEQAALLAGQLKHKPAAEKLVELLASQRPEVFTAAAWALREIAVAESLPAAHEHLKAKHKQLLASGRSAGMANVTPEQLDQQLSQLVQFIGQAKYKPADATLRALIPRTVASALPPGLTPVGGETRSAAVWSLGQLHSDTGDEELAQAILRRLTGDGTLGPDDARVRKMAPVALALMKATATVPTLREYSQGEKPTLDAATNACRWAVAQLEQKPPPPPGVVAIPQTDWFLVPRK